MVARIGGGVGDVVVAREWYLVQLLQVARSQLLLHVFEAGVRCRVQAFEGALVRSKLPSTEVQEAAEDVI